MHYIKLIIIIKYIFILYLYIFELYLDLILKQKILYILKYIYKYLYLHFNENLLYKFHY